MKKFYICDGKKYIIEDNNVYEIFNKQLITPTINELKKVNRVIKKTNKDIFSSPKLNEIAKKNKELYRIDVLPEILERMEKFIGVDNIDSFYRNLETVKFDVEDPIECTTHDVPSEVGNHDGKTNIIQILPDSFDRLRDYAEDKGLDFDLVWKIALAHELFHMASCNNLIFETGHLYQGLGDIDFNKKYLTNTDILKKGITSAFTEGITQLFACMIYAEELGDNFTSFCNFYEDQARIVGQLIPFVSLPRIQDSYFKNLGLSLINDKLLQIDKHKLLYDELSTNMGRTCSDRLSESVKNTSVVTIQSILLQYGMKFIEIIDKDKIPSFVRNTSAFFVGNWENMDTMNISKETKALIQENLKTLDRLKEKQKTYKK